MDEKSQIGYEEIYTEDVEQFRNDESRLVFSMPAASREDFTFSAALGFVKILEEKEERVEIVVFSPNALSHYRVAGKNKSKKLEKILNWLHLDYLPYAEVIVSLPRSEKSEKLLEEARLMFGIL